MQAVGFTRGLDFNTHPKEDFMITQVESIKARIAELESQKTGIQSQIDAVETRVNVVDQQQREVSLAAFSGDKAAQAKFETLTEEGIALSRKARGLEFAFNQLEEKITDAIARLGEAEREEKVKRLTALIERWAGLGGQLEKALSVYGALVDEAASVNLEIAKVCRELSIECDSARGLSLLEGQAVNMLRGRFPGIHWPGTVHRTVDFSATHGALLERAKRPPQPKSEVAGSNGAKPRKWIPLEEALGLEREGIVSL
jgi:DNA repair exonuclease SbcCD ATPase subunit